MEIRFVLIGGILPGAIATVLLLASWLPFRKSPDSAGPRWLLPLLLAFAMLPAELLVQGKLPFQAPPDQRAGITSTGETNGATPSLDWRHPLRLPKAASDRIP